MVRTVCCMHSPCSLHVLLICLHLSPVADLNGLDTDSHLLERHYNNTLIGSKDLYAERYVFYTAQNISSARNLCLVQCEPVNHASLCDLNWLSFPLCHRSPIHRVKQKSLKSKPLLMIVGISDTVVPAVQSHEFKECLEGPGSEHVRVLEYPGHHMFMMENIESILANMELFLAEHAG